MRTRQYGDFDMYWAAASEIRLHPGMDVYEAPGEEATDRLRLETLGWVDPAAPPGEVDPRYFVANSSTPFLFSALSLVSSEDLGRDFVGFQVLSTAAFLLFLLVFIRTWGIGPWGSLAVLVLVPLLFHPYRSDVGNGTPTRLLLGLVAASVPFFSRGTRGRSAAGGILLGVASALKPIVILAPAFLFLRQARRRDWRRLSRGAGGFAAAGAAGFLLAAARFRSWTIWLSWEEHLRAMPREVHPVTSGSFSLTDLLEWWTGADLSAVLPGASAALLVATLLLLPGDGTPEGGGSGSGDEAEGRRTWLVLSLGCTAFLLASPRAWEHYYLLSLPLLLALLFPEGGAGRTARLRRALGAAAAAMVSVVSPALLLPDEVVTETMLVALGTVMWCGVLLAFVTGTWLLAESGGAGAGDGGDGTGRGRRGKRKGPRSDDRGPFFMSGEVDGT